MSRRFFCKILLVVVAIVSLLVISSVLTAQGRSDWALEHAKEVQEGHTSRLMAIKDVVGTAVGLDGQGCPVVKVFTAREAVAGIPRKLDGVPVHVVVSGKFYALKKPPWAGGGEEEVDPTSRFKRPVPIGVSTGHPDITAGTIGCRVTDGTNVYALSNNHVYADENKANKDDNVLQPGTFDGGVDPDDAIGTLAEFEEIKFGNTEAGFNTWPKNYIDAAIALSSEENLGNATPPDGYGTPKSETISAVVNLPLKKYGRTTSLTKGKVYAVNAELRIIYEAGEARFVNQIVITPGSFSAAGDSGSLVVVDGKGRRNKQNDNKPVGLLFAGSTLYTIANPIDDVLERLGVTIDGK